MTVEPGVHLDELGERARVRDRGVGQAVDADHLGRNALANFRLVARLGQDHQPRVAVEVDEPRRHDLALGADQPARPPDGVLDRGRVAEHGDPRAPAGLIASHPDRTGRRRGARAIDDRPADDQQLVTALVRDGHPGHLASPRAWSGRTWSVVCSAPTRP
jgi:hypothetical protein